jgi:hypothetical protein
MSGHRKWADVKAERQAKVDHMELQAMRSLLATFDVARDLGEPTYDVANAIIGEARRLIAADDERQAQIAAMKAELASEDDAVNLVVSVGESLSRARDILAASDVAGDAETPYSPFNRNDPRTTSITAADEAALRRLPHSMGMGQGPADLSAREAYEDASEEDTARDVYGTGA